MSKFLSFLFLAVGLAPMARGGYGILVDKFDDSSVQRFELRFNKEGGSEETISSDTYLFPTPTNAPFRLANPSASVRVEPKDGYEKPVFTVVEMNDTKRTEYPESRQEPWTSLEISFSFETTTVRITDIKASLITRTATFCRNHSSGDDEKVGTCEVSYNKAYGKLPSPEERTGYTFGGWWSTRDESGGTQVTESTVFKGDVHPSWYARWTANTYTVALNAQGGEIANEANVTSYTYGKGAKLPTSDQMSRVGYTFAGWYETTEGGEEVKEIPKDATENKTYYARWTARTFEIRFFQNYSLEDSSVVKTCSVNFDATYRELPEVTPRTGYSFQGWWSTREASGGDELTPDTKFSSLSAPTNWYARWKPNTYTVTLNAKGGRITSGDVQSYTYSESASVQLPTTDQMIREGWTFVGWYETDSCTGTPVYEIPAGTTGDKGYFAKWAERAFDVRFFQNYSSEDQKVVATRSIAFGSKYGTLPSVERTGYMFDGWWSIRTRTGGTQVTSDTEFSDVSAPTNWYAHWKRATYTVTLDAQGGTIVNGTTSFSYQYGNSRQLPNQSQMKHPDRLTFCGWYSNKAGSGSPISAITADMTGNKTYYAQWKTNWVTFVLHQDQDRASFVPPSDANNPFLVDVDGNRVVYAVGWPWEILPTAVHSDTRFTLVSWYYEKNGQTNTVREADEVPNGVTELHAKWAFGDPLAQALDADGELEFVSKVLTQTETQWSTKWGVGFTTPFFGSSCVVVGVSSEEFERPADGKGVAVALETSVVGPGTLSFAWRMQMERIGATSSSLDPDESSDDWSTTVERLMFGVGATFGDGDVYSKDVGFKYGLAATDSKILIVTDPNDKTTEPVPWNGGWTNMSVKIDAGADETNVVRWIYFYTRGVQIWAATGWVDHVVWTPAGSGIVLPKTETSLSADITVPAEWPAKYPTFVEKYGSDLADALVKPTGKKTADGSSMYVWQDYVIGTDPTDPSSRLTASIKMGADGQPIITWSPDLSEATPKRVYIIYGASTLDGTWQPVSDENRAQMRFFKVGVDVAPSAE